MTPSTMAGVDSMAAKLLLSHLCFNCLIFCSEMLGSGFVPVPSISKRYCVQFLPGGRSAGSGRSEPVPGVGESLGIAVGAAALFIFLLKEVTTVLAVPTMITRHKTEPMTIATVRCLSFCIDKIFLNSDRMKLSEQRQVSPRFCKRQA